LNQKGHPKVTVSLEKYNRDYFIKFKQTPYPEIMFNNDQTWIIPLFIKTKGNEFIYIMKDKELLINTYELKMGNDFSLILNSNRSGFYRVEYSHNIQLYKNYTKYDIIGLLDDYISNKDYFNSLKLIDSLKPFDDRLILKSVLNIYETFKRFCFAYSSINKLTRVQKPLDTLTNDINSVFWGIIAYDFQKVVKLLDSSEQDNELVEMLLYVHCFIDKKRELIEYIIRLFESNPIAFIKIYNYLGLSIVLSNFYEFRGNKLKEKEYYLLALRSYNEAKSNFSNEKRNKFLNSFLAFENVSEELIELFYSNYIDNIDFYELFKNINHFNIFDNRSRVLNQLIKKLIKEKSLKTFYSINEFFEDNEWFFMEYVKIVDQVYDEDLVLKLNNYVLEDLEIICITHEEKKVLRDLLFRKTDMRAFKNKNMKIECSLIVKQVLEYFNKT
jgi:hypothetical protein